MLEKSEFVTLSDLAISQGVLHSEIITDVSERILVEYKRQYPENPQTVEVVVNEKSGEVRIMKDTKDVTPDKFRAIAERVAREVVIEKLKKGSAAKKEEIQKSEIKSETSDNKIPSELGKWVMGIIFWGYNLLYIFIFSTFLANLLINQNYRKNIFEQIQNGEVFQLFFVTVAAVIPFISVFSVVKLIGERSSEKVGSLFFLFEIPVVAFCLIISGMFTSLTPIIWFFSLIAISAIPVFLIHVLNTDIKSVLLQKVFLFLRQSILMATVYLTFLFTFFTPLIVGYLAKEVFTYFQESIFSFSPYRNFNPMEFIVVVTLGGLLILIILVLTASPYILCLALTRIFLKARKTLESIDGKLKTERLILIFSAIWIVFFALCSLQPNADKYLGKLEKVKDMTTFEEREALVKELAPHEAEIKRVFSDIANVRRRYIMTKNDNYLKDAYTYLGFSNLTADAIQGAFMTVAYPFVYQGSLDTNQKVYDNYLYVFGKSIYQDQYYNYYQPTYDYNAVNLVGRTVYAKTDYNHLLATVTFEDEFKNTTYQNQEVIYEFSLPADSVVTGLKLGANLEFDGVIAPKNAAVQTYETELRKRRDPAILEQTGPNQYRLRVFPIPPQNDVTTLNGRDQKIQIRYITVLTNNGYSLPIFSKEQNLNVSGAIVRLYVDGNQTGKSSVNDTFIYDPSLDKSIKNLCLDKSVITSHGQFGSADIYLIPNTTTAGSENSSCGSNGLNLTKLAKDMKIAVLFDVSNVEAGKDVLQQRIKNVQESAALTTISGDKLAKNNSIDIYKFNDLLSKPIELSVNNESKDLDFTLNSLNYFGTSDPEKAIYQLKGSYDFAIVITAGIKDSPFKQLLSLKKNFPVYIVHEEKIPPYTTKTTAEMMQSDGNTFTNFNDAFNYAILNKLKENKDTKEFITPGEFYSYYLPKQNGLFDIQNVSLVNFDINDPLLLLFARKYIDVKISRKSGDLNQQIDFLDQITAFAQKNSIVTPYSSFIALVNEQQKSLLESLSLNLDRYKETTPPAGGGDRVMNPINISPQGSFSPLSDTLFGTSMMRLDTGGSGGGSFGAIGAPAAMYGGGGVTSIFSGFSMLVLVNVLILGGGITIFIFLKLKRSIKLHKK